jgi:hypothetical protein
VRAEQPERPAPLRRSEKVGLLLLSLALSLVMAEGAAHLLHRGAFPFLNLYVPDPRLGVRLAPSTSTRVRSREGRITEIRTNALGFRGPAWPGPSAHPVRGRVLLLGDSQMFGYGVPFEGSLAGRLPRLLGDRAEVLDAAVPSWGPPEYARILAELGPTYRPETVLFVANLANDWFETSVSNERRTSAEDGWAVRARPSALQAQGPSFWRTLFFGRSHLVLAMRELWAHQQRPQDSLAPEAATQLMHDLEQLRRPRAGHRSPLTPFVADMVQRCKMLGCRVLAVALPIDVLVDRREWRKYRGQPIDVEPSAALLDDFLEEARSAGAEGVNLLPVLREASPDAFLPDDYHLSERGHAAIARALAAALSPPPTLAGALP